MKVFNLLLLVLIATPAIANDTANCSVRAPRGQQWKVCKDTVRASETVDQYLLTDSGDLYATLKQGAGLCQITNDVAEFKVSQHPADAAMIYYVRSGDLYVLNQEYVTPRTAYGDCPKTRKKVIMENVKDYKIATNTHTTIVNAALSNSGKLVAWDNVNPVYTEYNVADFQMNTCYGSKDKNYSTYVLFSMDYNGFVTKVKGKSSSEYSEYIAEKTTRGRYEDLSSFKQIENVCSNHYRDRY